MPIWLIPKIMERARELALIGVGTRTLTETRKRELLDGLTAQIRKVGGSDTDVDTARKELKAVFGA